MKPMLLQIYINKKFNISLLLFETSTFQVFLKATSKCTFPRPSAFFLNVVLVLFVLMGTIGVVMNNSKVIRGKRR